jgi:hypothetical protein
MSLNKYWKVSALIGALIIAPGFCMAAEPETCNATEVRLSCSQEAADLLTGIQQDNRELLHSIRDRRWERIQTKVADMTQQVSRLQAMETDLAPWEQRMIDQVAPLVRQIASNGEGNFAASSYENLYAQAAALARTLDVDAHAARVDARAMYLAPNLGMTELFR